MYVAAFINDCWGLAPFLGPTISFERKKTVNTPKYMNPLLAMSAIHLSTAGIQLHAPTGLEGDWTRSDNAVLGMQIHLDRSGSFDAIGCQKLQSAPVPLRLLHGSWERRRDNIILKISDSAFGSIVGPQTQPNGQPRELSYSAWVTNIPGPIVGSVSNDHQTIRIFDPFEYQKNRKSRLISLKRTSVKLRALDWHTIDEAIKRATRK